MAARGRRIIMETPEDLSGSFQDQTLGRVFRWTASVVKALKQIRDALDEGYPVPHAITHMQEPGASDENGHDSVMSSTLPGALLPGQPGALGDPLSGAQAGGHTHDTTALAGSGGADALTSIDLEWLHWRV